MLVRRGSAEEIKGRSSVWDFSFFFFLLWDQVLTPQGGDGWLAGGEGGGGVMVINDRVISVKNEIYTLNRTLGLAL